MKRKVLLGVLLIIAALVGGVGISEYKKCHRTVFEEFDFARNYFDERLSCDGDVGPIENEIMAKEKGLALLKERYSENTMKIYKSIKISYDPNAEIWRIICYHRPPDSILAYNLMQRSPCVYIQSDGKVLAVME